ERVGQDDGGAVVARAAATDARAGAVAREGHLFAVAVGADAVPQRGAAGVPGSVRDLQPVLPDQPRLRCRDSPLQPGDREEREAGADRGGAAGGEPASTRCAGTVSAPAQRRRAPAGDASASVLAEAE